MGYPRGVGGRGNCIGGLRACQPQQSRKIAEMYYIIYPIQQRLVTGRKLRESPGMVKTRSGLKTPELKARRARRTANATGVIRKRQRRSKERLLTEEPSESEIKGGITPVPSSAGDGVQSQGDERSGPPPIAMLTALLLILILILVFLFRGNGEYDDHSELLAKLEASIKK
eukprot:660203-Amorphochlora_amoeboformis.AAC.1